MKSDKDSFDTNAIPHSNILKAPNHTKNQTADGGLGPELSSVMEVMYLPEESGQFCLIRTHKRFKNLWNVLILILCAYLLAAVPFLISFHSSFPVEFIWLNVGIDSVFAVDLFFHFFTSFIDKKGEIKSLSLISQHYLKGWFAVDLFSVCPFDLITFYILGQSSVYFTAAWLINLLKLRNLTRSSKVIRNWQSSPSQKSVVKILELLAYIVAWVHCSACIWFVVIKSSEKWKPLLSWYKETPNIYDLELQSQYFISFYYGVWLSLGNEVSPQTRSEYITASLLIIFGAIGMAVLLGEMAVIISEMNEDQAFHQQIVDEARTNLENLGIPKDLLFKILNRIIKNQNFLRSHEEHETLQKFVSPSIQLKIAQALYDPILSTNPVFASENNLLTFLLDKIKIRFAKDEEEVIHEGQETRSLYFVIAGEIKVMSFNHQKMKSEKVCFLQPGSHFGELGLIYGGNRRATCVSEGYSTLAELSKNDFFLLANLNPNIIPKLREFCEHYTDWTKNFICRSLKFSNYFQNLPTRVYNELPFMMTFKKIEKGRYLFRPGDLCEELFVLVSGSLEVSVTVNDRYIQYLKIQEDIADLGTLGRTTKREGLDYSDRHFDLFSVNGLKRTVEVFPYLTPDGRLKYSKSEDHIPVNSQRIGNFPQEIVLCVIRPGALVNSRLVLFQKEFQVQCKASETSVIYSLSSDSIDMLSKTYFSFKKAVIKEKKLSNPSKSKTVPLSLDILQLSLKHDSFRVLFKEHVLRVLFNNRSERMKKWKSVAGLCNKIKAVLACSDAGEFELAEKVMEGKVLPENISEDGRLLKFSKLCNDALPASHPIVETFRLNLESLSNPKSPCLSTYNIFAQEVLNETQRVAEMKKSLYEVKNSLQVVTNQLKDKARPEEVKKKNKNLLSK